MSKKTTSADSRAQPVSPSVAPVPPTRRGGSPLLLVGIGASAGGIAAVSELLRELPESDQLALVIVMHLSAEHKSELAEVLGSASRWPVEVAQNNHRVEAGVVYVIPAGKYLTLDQGRFKLSPRVGTSGEFRPIDQFMRSLAQEQAHKSIGVLLSGGGSDGSLGIEEIKAAGGITLAQDQSAEFGSMPDHAIASGRVDFVLPPAGIARELIRIAGSSWVDRTPDEEDGNEAAIERVLSALRSVTGVDFSQYKRNTVNRRIARRMIVHKMENLEQYATLLAGSPAEVEALYTDILITVTSFFRNPEAYEALKEKVFPRLTEGRSPQEPVRVWCVGCATGEEAFSVAMAFTEYLESSGRQVPLQVFATDLNSASIDKARSGVYNKGVALDVSPERLQRFFVDVDGVYRVSKAIRDMCLFARQNAVSDPPFSRLDLICCRNMLIYLEAGLQRRLLPILHYALQPKGFLWLGQSETINTYRELFEAEDAKQKIYARKGAPNTGASLAGRQLVPEQRRDAPAGIPGRTRELPRMDPQREADRIVLARFAPSGVLVNAKLEVVQFRGDTGAYLAPAPGRPGNQLLRMLREGLAVGVRSAVKQAQRTQAAARAEGMRLMIDGQVRDVAVSVTPLRVPGDESLLLILFEGGANPQAALPETAPGDVIGEELSEDKQEIGRLHVELAATRDYLQTLIEAQEATNEELQRANEEVQSANEELQSINEELQTSKEEIQSTNEELATVNDELRDRNAQTSSDWANLLSSSQMAIVMLNADLRIRRYTPAAEKLLNLIASDVDRPFTDIKPSFEAPDLHAQLLEVLDNKNVEDQEIQDRTGRWYLLRSVAYRTPENRVAGVVIMLIDIDRFKRAVEELRESEARFRSLAQTLPALIWSAGSEGFDFVNAALCDFFGERAKDLLGFGWLQRVHPSDRVAVKRAYGAALESKSRFEVSCRMKPATGPYRRMRLSAQPRFVDTSRFQGFAGGLFEKD